MQEGPSARFIRAVALRVSLHKTRFGVREIARAAGLSHGPLSRFLNGKQSIDVATADRLLAGLCSLAGHDWRDIVDRAMVEYGDELYVIGADQDGKGS